MRQAVEVTGSLCTLDDVSLSPKVSGRLTQVYVREGDTVQAGQVLFEQETKDLMTQLRQAEAGLAGARSQLLQAKEDAASSPVQTSAGIESARAALAQAQAALRKLEQGARDQEIAQAEQAVEAARARWEFTVADHKRLSSLFDDGAISEQQLDAARTEMDSAKAAYDSAVQALSLLREGAREEDLEAARQAVRQAEQQLVLAEAGRTADSIKRERVVAAEAAVRQAEAGVQLATQQLADARVYSPITGQVEERYAHPGQMVMPGTPILRIVSLGNVCFEGNVPETEIRYVSVGQAVDVRVDAYPNEVLSGRVAAIRPMGDEQARLFAVRIALSDEQGRLRPGMFARGQVLVRTVPEAIVVSKDAVVSRHGATTVFVVSKGTAEERAVTTGLSDVEYFQVTGVEPGEQVVVKGQDILTDGARVQIERTHPGEPGGEEVADGRTGRSGN
jgi:RND family efflux transporter MFP subunit